MVVNSEYVPIPLSGSACGRRAAARRRRRACRSRSARTRPRSPPRGRVRCAPTPRQTRDRAPPAWRVDGRDVVRSACAAVSRRASGVARAGAKRRRLCSGAQRAVRPGTTSMAMLDRSCSRSTASASHAVPTQPSLPPRSAAMGIERVYIHRSWSALRSVALLAEQPCAPHSGSPRCQISSLRRCAWSPSLLLWASEEPARTRSIVTAAEGSLSSILGSRCLTSLIVRAPPSGRRSENVGALCAPEQNDALKPR